MSDYAKMRRLPVIAMRGLVVLPDMVGHIDLKTKDVEGAFRSIMEMDSEVVLATMREGIDKITDISSVFPVGVIATIKQRVSLPNGNVRLLLEGRTRVEFRDLRVVSNGSYLGDVVEKEIIRASFKGQEEEVRIRMLAEILGEYVVYQPQVPKNVLDIARNTTDLYNFMLVLMAKIPFQAYTKLSFLMQEREDTLFEVLYREFLKELEIVKLRHEINDKISQEVSEAATQQRKEYYLKEQLKAIKKELGDDEESDADKFREKLSELKASDEIKENIEREIERFERMQHSASEAAVGYQYLDTLLSIPWEEKSEDNTDLENAKNVLDEDHYGLKDVKERVLEFLAVRALNTKGDTPILCLVGPPGTGKTSIAKSVARAMNRKYERVCLGGVRDEAELRGHRRTYVGAMPGRLVKALLHAKVVNPLILLDEVDKLGSDYKGDPAAALLEVLDGEQNAHFMDHYVDMPIDLSPVLFLATANDANNIPKPLLDRMEIIELSSYLETEKFHIGKEHLWPKQLEANGLKKNQLTITDSAIRTIISCYTKEAGVRSLERAFGKINRKAAKKILLGETGKISVTERNLEEFLGKKKYSKEKKAGKDKVGIANGLAWTQVGGEALEIEVDILPGKGEVDFTGQLGDVMKESCLAAMSYVRSVAPSYSVSPETFKENDVHIHIPEGAVPKDGPSAGITIATALLSAVTNIPVKGDLAMTGEITLRGRVLEIGGLKEKLLAAKGAGMKTVLIPEGNEKDVAEFDEEIVAGMEIIPVEEMDDVLKQALVR